MKARSADRGKEAGRAGAVEAGRDRILLPRTAGTGSEADAERIALLLLDGCGVVEIAIAIACSP
jgi:hypothetical protein